MSKATQTRSEMRKVLKLHRGSIAQIARGLGISMPTVSGWLRGRGNSARVEKAVIRKVAELKALNRKSENQHGK